MQEISHPGVLVERMRGGAVHNAVIFYLRDHCSSSAAFSSCSEQLLVLQDERGMNVNGLGFYIFSSACKRVEK